MQRYFQITIHDIRDPAWRSFFIQRIVVKHNHRVVQIQAGKESVYCRLELMDLHGKIMPEGHGQSPRDQTFFDSIVIQGHEAHNDEDPPPPPHVLLMCRIRLLPRRKTLLRNLLRNLLLLRSSMFFLNQRRASGKAPQNARQTNRKARRRTASLGTSGPKFY